MRLFDVVGYADYDGSVYCPDCALDHSSPIFADAEFDYPLHCDACGDFIPVTLTDTGVRYVLQALAHYLRHGQGNKEILEQWANTLDLYSLKISHCNLVQRFLEGVIEDA